MKRIVTLVACVSGLLVAGTAAAGQQPDAVQGVASASAPRAPWSVDFALMNTLDGNINHDPTPVRSVGLAPVAHIAYQPQGQPRWTWDYEIALNRFTATNEWDRVSHNLGAAFVARPARGVQLQTEAEASYKGSSEDREIANEVGVSERIAVRLAGGFRVVGFGGYRYKEYPDSPGTSGPSPYVGGKVDRRFGERRLAFAYKFQTRDSQATRDQYRRHVWTASYSTALFHGDRLTGEFEYRAQRYNRLIKVGANRVLREDRRMLATATYERRVAQRFSVVWVAAFEERVSNDVQKEYVAPSFVSVVRYHWR